ncbi:MAG TPA: YbhB/YbcL family Raf kinase inhibitor-like protein [Candidatus Elarobacter sp.]
MIRALGRLMRRRRAGPEHSVREDDRFVMVTTTLDLRSDAFADGGELPADASPPLSWTGVPEGTQTLVLIVEDVDVPLPRPFTHAVVYAIDPARTAFAPGELAAAGDDYALGFNGYRRAAYLGPHPLPGHGPHRYVFTMLAVSFRPHFDQPPSRGRVLDAIAGHVLALGELTAIREG